MNTLCRIAKLARKTTSLSVALKAAPNYTSHPVKYVKKWKPTESFIN